ncbi:MAG: hypothetical protein AABZ12_04305 [Planctomycetota bacterium]
MRTPIKNVPHATAQGCGLLALDWAELGRVIDATAGALAVHPPGLRSGAKFFYGGESSSPPRLRADLTHEAKVHP